MLGIVWNFGNSALVQMLANRWQYIQGYNTVQTSLAHALSSFVRGGWHVVTMNVTVRVGQPHTLTENDQLILDFEHQLWRYAGSKEHAIRQHFGISATRYFQQLNALLDCPYAMAYDPMVIKRLRRLRALRRRERRGSRQLRADR